MTLQNSYVLILGNHGNPCEASSITVTECPGVTLQKSTGSGPETPCVPEPKDEL
jgi:hypothetical protein